MNYYSNIGMSSLNNDYVILDAIPIHNGRKPHARVGNPGDHKTRDPMVWTEGHKPTGAPYGFYWPIEPIWDPDETSEVRHGASWQAIDSMSKPLPIFGKKNG